LAQRLVDFAEDFARDGTGVGQRLAHAHRLAALARKDECPHHALSSQIMARASPEAALIANPGARP
jgi:hypothetical protein